MHTPSDAMEKPKRVKPKTRNDRAEEALRESERKFRVLAETMPAAIFLYQGDKYIYVNPAAEKITGYPKEELIGMNFWDWVSPEYKDIVRDRGRARQMGEDVPSRYEVKYQARDGQEGWADFAAGLIEYEGRPAVIAIAFDVTNRKKAEKALRKSQFILSKAQEIAHVGNWAWNVKTGAMSWSDEGFRIFGYLPKELEPSLDFFISRIHPDDKDTVEKSTNMVRYRYKLGSIDYRIVRPDGTIRYVNSVSDKIVRDANGDPLWVYGIYQDITARKQAEKALVKSRAILARAQDIAHVGNWAWDLKTNNLQWSDEIFKIFGYRPQELQPTYDWFLSRIFPDDRELIMSSARAAIRENKLFNIDFRIITPDGAVHYLNIVADRIKKDKAGDPDWMYGIVEDITKRKTIENKLRDAQSQAELYVDLMGHDINNMNMVALGFLEMADDKLSAGGTLDMSDEHLLQKAVENIKNSSTLIDNVRKLQRERAGELKLKAIDIAEVLASVKDQYLNVPGRDVRISLCIECSCVVIANDLLRDVFSNLVGNSVKHSTGPLIINIYMTCDGEKGMKFCKVAVEDNGPGIPDSLKALIFDRSQTAKKLRGKGLGLYIVNTLVSDFHGKVWVEDRVPGDHSKGAKFVVMLPAIEK